MSVPLRRVAWQHPEWWSLALSGIAWMWLVASIYRPHGMHHTAPGIVDWVAMVVAMMVPLVVYPIRTTASRSLCRRRHRAIAAFLAGYIGPWVGIAVAGSLLARILHQGPTSSFVTAGAIMAAAAWQMTSAKRLARQACHRTAPLAPHGWRADRDCVRYGWTIGTRCVLSCGPLMLACALASHTLTMMLCAGASGIAERYARRDSGWITAAGLSALAVMYASNVLR